MKTFPFTAIIEREGSSSSSSGFVALCAELDIASQGETVEEARQNLQEAVELFFECASSEEVRGRLPQEIYITRMEAILA
ncbi:MAG: type II toxin-antitoxin system HicB family antitoxin [Candidatus Kapaibacteriota bacterium]